MTESVDQASSLRLWRRLRDAAPAARASAGQGTRRAPLVAVASGKGGVGKTLLAVNLALALREQGRRCLLADLDWGLANVDVALGLAPARHAGHVLRGACAIDEALVEYGGISILPNGCGDEDLAALDPGRPSDLLEMLRTAGAGQDTVIADTHPGIGELTLLVLLRAEAIVVVTTPEPTALTDTYALLKVMRARGVSAPTGLIVNQAASPLEAGRAALHLDAVSRRFLGRGISCWGRLPEDSAVPRSIQLQRPLLQSAPRSAAAAGVREIAASLLACLGERERFARRPQAGSR